MKTIREIQKEKREALKLKPVLVTKDKVVKLKENKVDYFEIQPIEDNSIIEEQEEYDLNELTKDELNDYAASLGFDKEIKGWWNKSRMITSIIKLTK